MEFGLVGALLILAALTWAIITAGRLAAQARDAFTGALADWSVMLLVVTAVYSPVYAPGEVASLTALVWYLSQRGQGQFKA
jgi:cell division protein FtsW (lipid II flippase)